ncbi:MAG: hypothetical protein ACFFCW_47680, partial [Candidatus Hodarchaeota archaeon]
TAFTWAIVGGLLVDPGNKDIGLEIIPLHNPHARTYHSNHPDISSDGAYMWYGRDIVDAIRNCQVAQEIGCHSFSHISYDEGNCSIAAVASDLEHCRTAFQALDLTCKAFVYPFNRVGHLRLLPRHGFICYRGPELHTHMRSHFLTPLLKACRLLCRLFAGPPVLRPTLKYKELVNIQASMLFRVPEIKSPKVWRTILDFQVKSAKQGLSKAARTGRVFHLWFHPFQFGHRTKEMLGALDEVLSSASRLRSDNKLEILTMGQMAQRIIGSNEETRENKKTSYHSCWIKK